MSKKGCYLATQCKMTSGMEVSGNRLVHVNVKA
jgi:hypothetical protein